MASRSTEGDVPTLEPGRRVGDPPPTPMEMARAVGLVVFMIVVVVLFAYVLH